MSWKQAQRSKRAATGLSAILAQIRQMLHWRTWSRQLRYFYHRFVRLRSSPEAMARGLAAGVFAGCFPMFGLQTIIGVTLAALVRGSKILAAGGTWVSNPFTYVPIFAFNFQVGERLLGQTDVSLDLSGVESWQSLMALGADLVGTLFLGCFVVGVIAAICSYFFGHGLVLYLRRRQQSRQHRRRRR